MTIIGRVRRRLNVYDGDLQGAVQDGLFRQSVINLKEFQESWPGKANVNEIDQAECLYKLHSGACIEFESSPYFQGVKYFE
jgi:hypothetical protein